MATGLAHHPDGSRLYIPFTVPGDAVRARPVMPRGDGWLAETEALPGTRLLAGVPLFAVISGSAAVACRNTGTRPHIWNGKPAA